MRPHRLFPLSLVVMSVVIALIAIGLALGRSPQAQAAPTGVTYNWPGAAPCNLTLQVCIDGVSDGDQIIIAPGTYVESVSIQKSITLTSPSPTTTLQALTGQRVVAVSAPSIIAPGPRVRLVNLTLESGDVTSATGGCPMSCGGGLLVYDRAQVVLDGVSIVRNQAVRGGGVYVDQGSVTLMNGQISSNHAIDPGQSQTTSGGGVYVANAGSVFEQNDGVISLNTAVDGAGVFVQDGQYIQNGGEISFNTASQWGGGLLVANSSANAQLFAGRILSNTASVMGGGVFVDAGVASIYNAVVAGNSVSSTPGWGGGIAVWQKSGRVFHSGGTVADNSATNGGGYAIISGTVVLGGSAQVVNNRATQRGGGAYLEAALASLTQVSGVIGANDADVDGGGVTVLSGLYTQRGGDVISNTALNTGGGVSVDNGGGYQLWSGRVMSNTAALGGGVSVLFGTATISGGAVIGNQASQGGGVYVSSGVVDLSGTGSISNNNASSGGGVFVGSGQFNLRGGKIARNVAGMGGGIYLQSATSTLDQVDGLVTENQSPGGSGGGLYMEYGVAQIKGGQYSRNQAYLYGGGIASQYGTLIIGGPSQILDNQLNPVTFGGGGGVAVISGTAVLTNGVIISGNSVAGPGYGGGLYSSAPIVITGVRFISNTAAVSGGGAYFSGGDDVRVVNSLFARNAAASGAGLALDSRGQMTLLHVTVGDVITNPNSAIEVLNGTTGITNSIVASHSIGLNGNNQPVIEDYNLYFGNGISSTGSFTPGLHDLDQLDPLFVNPARR